MSTPEQVSICQNIIPSVQNLFSNGGKLQLTSIPSQYAYFKNPADSTALPGDGIIPVIDYSLLISEDPDQKNECVSDLGKACRDWGSFMVKNLDIPEKQYEAMFEKCEEFNSMSDDEKQEFKMKKNVMDRIIFGSSINVSSTQVRFWRDYLKLFVHPDFNSPKKPAGFSEKLLEISTKQREVMKKLLSGVSKSLGVEESYLYNKAEMDKGMDFCVMNIYPPCPQPELAVGLSPHTDFGLLSILTANGVSGLQIQQNGKWFNVNIPKNHLMVNLGDHMEILTNGKYKSAVHRAMVNKNTTRISLVTFYGAEVNNFVAPASKFSDNISNPPAYRGMKYGDYFVDDQSSTTKGLDLVRI